MQRGNISSTMSRANHTFSRAPQVNIPRSTFDRSHGCKTTFDAGYLVPVLVDEALPGDSFNLSMTAFARLATPLTPFMDNLVIESFFFAVPVRLIWSNWERFNGAQDNPDDSTDYVIPVMESPETTGYAAGSLSDYFGIPTEIPELEHASLWHRAYNLIYNQWYRDENLQDSVVVDMDDGPDDPDDYVLLRRGKRYDYFTSCLPFPQKGPAVELPLGTSAPVVADSNGIPTFNVAGLTNTPLRGDSGDINAHWVSIPPSGAGSAFWNNPHLQVDLTAATAATINQIREAFQIQRMYERDARGGTRYIELIKSHFGVTSPDARLQRAEYLGGGTSYVQVNPIAKTAGDGTTDHPLGTLAAYGVASMNGHGFTKSFVEHSLILGFICVRADLNYQQGLNRMFSRQTRFDFFWPALSHLGEQAVLNKELMAQGPAVLKPPVTGTPADDQVFGYQERYAEYRYKPSIITGQFRSNFAQTLDIWHLAQNFATLPELNEEFIVEDPPVDRVKALGDDYPDFLLDAFFHYRCARPMPVYGVPGLVDHF